MRKKFFSFLILVLVSGFFMPFSQSQAAGETLGYTTSVDIYLDVDNPNYVNGQMFNWTSATRAYDPQYGNCSGASNFVFSCSFSYYQDVKSFMCTTSRDPLNVTPPWVTGSNSIFNMPTGWYTFKHSFYDDGTGALLVKMEIINNGNTLKTWEFNNTNEKIGVDVGGPRHGWFSKNELGYIGGWYSRLPIDNSQYCYNNNCVFDQGFETDESGWFPKSYLGFYPYRVANSESLFLASSGNYYAMASFDSFTAWGDSPSNPKTDCTWPVALTPVRSAVITSPTVNQLISGALSLEASLYNDNTDAGLDWWVKTGECSDTVGVPKIGNTSSDIVIDYLWEDNTSFSASADTSTWVAGKYCFIFDPKESIGESDIKLTVDFEVADQTIPVAEILNPVDNSILTAPVTISAKATDAELTRCELTIKSNNDGEIVRATEEFTAADCLAGISVDWNTATDNVAEGDYIISFKAFDGVNLGEDSHLVKVEIIPPVNPCVPPYDKKDCLKNGWKLMEKLKSYHFKNQGACVSFIAKNFNPHGCKR